MSAALDKAQLAQLQVSAEGESERAHQYKPKLEPNAQPALMAGWKLEFGLRYKGVLIVLDYEALREGKIVIVPAPDREVYTRDNVVFHGFSTFRSC